MAPRVFFTFVLLVLLSLEVSLQETGSISRELDRLLENYDKRIKPGPSGEPVDIKVTLYIMDMGPIDEENMDFSTTFYFRQSWKEPRMAGIRVPNWDGRVARDSEFIDRIWIPDTFFPNDKDAEFHRMTVPNSFTKIQNDGTILRSVKVTTTSSCPMNLREFPHDEQKCNIEIESYGYTANDVHYSWGNGSGQLLQDSIGVSPEVSLMHHDLVGYCMLNKTINLSTGNYSRLVVELVFKREISYYLLTFYLPTIVSVLISWGSLCLHRVSQSGQLVAGVAPIVILSVLLESAASDAFPHASYFRALDLYLVVSFVFVVVAFLEVMVIAANSSDRGKNGGGNKMGKYSRILLPLAYFGFNGLYWTMYLSGHTQCEGMIPHDH